MARSHAAPRPALLPPDAATRLDRTIRRRLLAPGVDSELVDRARSLCMPWLLARGTRVRPDRRNRLRLAPDANETLNRLARSLTWLAVPDSPHGQQAAEAAAKMVRAIRTRRVNMDGLINLEAAYRACRQAHYERREQATNHAPDQTVLLDDGDMVATRITSERLLVRLGRQARNCLAGSIFQEGFAIQLRQRQTEFWRIDPADQPKSPVWVIALSAFDSNLEEAAHAGPFIAAPRDRDALREFLVRRAQVGRDAARFLERIGLSPNLVSAAKNHSMRRFPARFLEATWRFEAGPGVLAAVPMEGPTIIGERHVTSWMLHGTQTDAAKTLAVQCLPPSGADPDDDDEPLLAGPQTMQDLTIRLGLRRACLDSPALRRACKVAFAADSPLFIEDWSGIVPRGRRSVARAVLGQSRRS